MDIPPNTSGFLLNSSTHESVHFQAKEDEYDDGSIDLGLSLRALQPQEDYHPSGRSRRMPLLCASVFVARCSLLFICVTF